MPGNLFVTPDKKKRFLARATRARRELRKEETAGYIRDGSGNRYRVGVFFLLAGDVERAADAFDWFEETFTDDVGEPIFFLYGALTAYRRGRLSKARVRLAFAKVCNIFLLPYLLRQGIDATGVWLSSNWADESYLAEMRDYLDGATQEDRAWIASEWNSAPFVTLREGYLSTYRALNAERDLMRRRSLLTKWDLLQARQFAKLERQSSHA